MTRKSEDPHERLFSRELPNEPLGCHLIFGVHDTSDMHVIEPERLLAQNIQVSAVAISLKPDSMPRSPLPEGPPSSWRR